MFDQELGDKINKYKRKLKIYDETPFYVGKTNDGNVTAVAIETKTTEIINKRIRPIAGVDTKAEKKNIFRPEAAFSSKDYGEPNFDFSKIWGRSYENNRIYENMEDAGKAGLDLASEREFNSKPENNPYRPYGGGGYSIH